MMQTLNKTLMAMALATALPSAALAVDVPLLDVVFDPTAIAGAGIATAAFTFDEIVVSTIGVSTVTVTDTSGDGTLAGPDAFTETGIVYNANFKLDGAGLVPGTTGNGITYDMFAIFDPVLIAGTGLAGTADIVGLDNVATFTPALTNAIIVVDTIANGGYDPGADFTIGTLTLGTGNCVLTPAVGGTFAEGSCGLVFAFDAAAVTDAGVWTRGGTDMGLLNASMALDVDVDSITPPLALVYPGGVGSSQTVSVIHDGSTAFQIPEPASLALLGIGLLGMAASQRRRRAA